MSETKAHAEGVFQGKVLAFLEQWKDFSASWIAHIASDDKNIKEIRDEIASIKVTMAWYAGGAAVVGALSGAIIPLIIQQVIK